MSSVVFNNVRDVHQTFQMRHESKGAKRPKPTFAKGLRLGQPRRRMRLEVLR